MKKILMLSTRYPFPVRKGDQAVIKTMLAVLNSKFKIDFVCFGKESERAHVLEKQYKNINFQILHPFYLPNLLWSTSLFFLLYFLITYIWANNQNLITKSFHYSGKQRVHVGETPRLGGLTIFIFLVLFSFFLSNLLFVQQLQVTLLCLLPMMLIISKEDLAHNVAIRLRFLALILSAAALMTFAVNSLPVVDHVIWERAYESILARPFLGVSFWVKPYGYELAHIFDSKFFYTVEHYNNPNYEIHSAWIRIFAENGLALFALIVSTIGYCLFKTWQLKQWTLSFYMLSILFYLSFVTRHITLNIVNALL